MRKPKIGYIAIVLNTGKRKRVRAEMCGDVFAIHNSIDGWGGRVKGAFTVTHVPTGFAAVQRISKDDATKAVRALLNLGVDWSFTDESGLAKRKKATAKRIVSQFEKVWP